VLADAAQRLHDLLEGQDQPDVARLAPQPPADLGQLGGAAGACEVTLRVGLGEAGAHPGEARG
jgi:hypothetical protein